MVKKAFSKRASILTKMDEDDLSKPVNSDVVKKISCMMYFVNK